LKAGFFVRLTIFFIKDCYTEYEDKVQTEVVRICKDTPQKTCESQQGLACEIREQKGIIGIRIVIYVHTS